jgi:ubiquinone/menaquinone biosynthesis C-methylase UbiE
MAYALQMSEVEIARYRMMADRARATESELWEAAGIAPGARVADVGCGPAAVTAVLGELVGPSGSVMGVDTDPNALVAAASVLEQAGVSNATVQVGSADASGLEAGTFDVAMLRHVLAHNGGHEQQIVDHLASLVRPGGAVYLTDVAMSSMAVRPPMDFFDEVNAAYATFMGGRGNDLNAGLLLSDRLVAAGLTVEIFRGSFTIMPFPSGMRPPAWAARDAMAEAGVLSPDDLIRWEARFEALDTMESRPTLFMPGFVAIGRKSA